MVGVSDGDTIKVLHNGKAEKIRLNGVDAPEKGQTFGMKAKAFTSEMVFGKDASGEVQSAQVSTLTVTETGNQGIAGTARPAEVLESVGGPGEN